MTKASETTSPMSEPTANPTDPCGVCHSAPCSCHRLEALAVELLVDLGLTSQRLPFASRRSNRTVTDVLAAFDSVRTAAPSQEPSPVDAGERPSTLQASYDAGFAAGRASAKAEQARKYRTGQRVRFFTGPEWVPATIGQFGLEPTRYEVVLDEQWRGDNTYWASDVDIQPTEQAPAQAMPGLDAAFAEANLIAWALRAEDHRLGERALGLSDMLRDCATPITAKPEPLQLTMVELALQLMSERILWLYRADSQIGWERIEEDLSAVRAYALTEFEKRIGGE